MDPRADQLVERLVAGEVRALARVLSLLERHDPLADALFAAVLRHRRDARIIAFTGPPGVGKSTLVGRFVAAIRASARRVAVVAVDPSSPLTGGAVLGDRLRMTAHADDPGVFLRSMASRGASGGLAWSLLATTTALSAAGWELIVIETVGTGQSEVEVVDEADFVVVVTAPGLGDEVQAIKAGQLEIADALVVNKADLPRADLAARQLESAVALRRDRTGVSVSRVSAETGEGVDTLLALVDGATGGADARALRDGRRQRALRRMLAERAAKTVRDAMMVRRPSTDRLCDELTRGTISLRQAVARAVRLPALDGGNDDAE